MWPYTGEENKWLGRAESASSAKSGPAANGVSGGNQSAESAQNIGKPSAAPAGWQRALDRLFKTPDQLANENELPLVAARLKDPLNAIRDSARALRGNPDLPADQQAHYLDVVLQENEHLAEMISAMLDRADLAERRKQRA
ncbi:MAG TPA: hypothetical protein VM639_15045 [Dongiaceae bacterium]|nr:hypothetical protein [Dongiaceae bacterium]